MASPRSPIGLRSSKGGYGSARLDQACEVGGTWAQIHGEGLHPRWARLRNGAAWLWWYRRRLPAVKVDTTLSPQGKMIREHFAIRRHGIWRYRHAQGVLSLPADFADYISGRHRQAVRTNVGHTRRAGLTAICEYVDDWEPGVGDERRTLISPGPVERWNVVDPEGRVHAQAILTVDEEVALLHGLMSYSPKSRWLLHTTLVERLCGECRLLLVNSEDAYLTTAGNRYFQRLLGYEVATLKLRTPVMTRLAVLAAEARPWSSRLRIKPVPEGAARGPS